MRIGTLGVASAAVRFAGQTDRGLVRLPPDSLASLPPQHLGRRHRLVKPRIGYEQVRAQPRAILHQCMGTQRQLRRLPTASARQLRLRSVVLSCVSLLRRSPLKSTIPVPSPPSFGGRPPFFFKLLKLAHDSMSVQSTVKCSVDNSRCPFCEPQNLFEEATSDVGFHQLLPHSRKVQLITTRLLQPHIVEPAKEQVVVQLFAEGTVGANRVQRNQQLPFQQLFRSFGTRDSGVK